MSNQTENVLAKQKELQENSIANAPTKKKIGFFSAMMVAVGSCVGSGIFFKAGSVLENSQGSIVFAMFCWIFAAFAVICMALALIEIASARNDNLSMIGWCKTFNSRIIYKACKNFMFYVYLPLNYFVMPLYVIMAFQDGVASIYAQKGEIYHGFGTGADWAIMMVITLAMSIYFILVCGVSSKVGNIQNWIITSVKFIPLVFAAIIGFVIVGMNHHIAGDYAAGFKPQVSSDASDIYSFASLTPGFGLFIAAGAIFFAYDGFYAAAGLQSEMKEPKKTPTAILIGLILVTVIYLIIAISMSLGSMHGNPQGLVFWFAQHKILPLFATFQILIGIGILGVINGFALWAPRFTEDLIREGELPYSVKAARFMVDKKIPWMGIVYNLIISLPIVVIFCIIGGLGYVNGYDANGIVFSSIQNLATATGKTTNDIETIFNAHVAHYPNGDNGQPLTFINKDNNIVYYYGAGVGALYTFCDVMANWTALFAFLFIVLAIAGGLRNRKTNKIKTEKSKLFVPFAILTVLTMSLPIFFTIFQPIADLFFLFRIPDLGGANQQILISRIMGVVVMGIYFALMFLPIVIEDSLNKKKFGSIEAAEVAKLNAIRQTLGEPTVDSYEEKVLEEEHGTMGEPTYVEPASVSKEKSSKKFNLFKRVSLKRKESSSKDNTKVETLEVQETIVEEAI